MTLLFDEAKHRYTYNGGSVPGVTEVLTDVYGNKLEHVDPVILAEASLLGKRVHRMIELYIRKELDFSNVDFDLVDYLVAWEEFYTRSGFEPLLSEQQVYSKKYGYAGTLDLFGRLNGEIVLPDIKRVTTIPETAGMQTAAYKQGLIETLPEMFKNENPDSIKRYALQLKPGAKWALHPLHNPNDLRCFLAAKTVFDRKRKLI